MRKLYFFAIIFAGICTSLIAQNYDPQLLLDLNTGSGSSKPNHFIKAQSSVYFAADPGLSPYISYCIPAVTDGTTAGTDTIGGSLITQWTTGSDFPTVPFGNDILFMHGAKLLRLNADGVTLLKDGFTANQAGRFSVHMAFELNGKIYFWAQDATSGMGVEMYVTDGTPEGTEFFMEFSSGSTSSHPFGSTSFFKYGNTVYFLARVNGNLALYKTDGTTANTVQVDIIYNSYSADFIFFPFTETVGGKIFISGENIFIDPTNDVITELAAPPSKMPNSERLLNDTMYFLGDGKIYKSWGTTDVAVCSDSLIMNTLLGGITHWIVPDFATRRQTSINNKAIFIGNNTQDETNQCWVWAYDQLTGNTEVILDTLEDDDVNTLYVCGNKMLIQYDKSMFITDGTKDSTFLLVSGPTGTYDPDPSYYMDEDNCRLYFTYKTTYKASDGFELYYIDVSESISGIMEQVKEKFDFMLYPNPITSSTVNVNVIGSYDIEVANVCGTTILRKENLNNTQQINLGNVAKGLYFVRIHTKEGFLTKKLIIN